MSKRRNERPNSNYILNQFNNKRKEWKQIPARLSMSLINLECANICQNGPRGDFFGSMVQKN